MLKRFAICLLGALAGSALAASPNWSFATLGTLGGNVSWATGINNAGEVVGWSGTVRGEFTETDPEYHAFAYGNGRMRDLGRAGDNSSAWAINDRGAIAGLSHAEGVWIVGGATAKTLGFQGTPYDINQFGVIAGTYDAGGEFRAFTHRGGILSELGTLGGGWSHAEAINDRGVVVGSSVNAAGMVRGFVHERGRMRELGTLGGPHSQAFDVNERGVVVGSAGNDSNGVQAFIHDGVMRALFPMPRPQDVSEAHAINNRNQVVGTLNDAGFLWDNGKLTMLRDLLTPAEQLAWGVLTPLDINDRGWIVGVASSEGVNGIPGGSRRAFILKPKR